MIALATPAHTKEGTPLVEIARGDRTVLCKLEGANVSGSHKSRPAQFLINDLRASGKLKAGSRLQLLLSSSGNFAKGIAHHTRTDETEIHVVMDKLSPPLLIAELEQYPHVRVTVIDEPDQTGSHLHARLRLIRELLEADPQIEFLDQYNNQLIPEAYAQTLAPELGRQVDLDRCALFVPVGTGATLNGFLRYRTRQGGSWPIFAVDANGSGLFRPPIHGARRLLSGYGNGKPTGLITQAEQGTDYVGYATDAEAVEACWRLRWHDRLFVGPSSGAALAVIEKVFTRRPDLLPKHCRPIAILPDWGDAYRETVFNRQWLRARGLEPDVHRVINLGRDPHSRRAG